MVNAALLLCMLGLFISFNLSGFGFGIRIQASDFIIPIMGITALKQTSFKDTLKCFNTWVIPIIFTSILLMGLASHWLNFGAFNFWGIKKIIGWGICIGYFVIGLSLYEKREKAMQALIVASWIMGIVCLIAASITITRSYVVYADYPRLQGFMGNPNAYGIFFVFTFILQIALNSTLPYAKKTKTIGMIILSINLLGTSSRAAYGAFIIACFVQALKIGQLKRFLTATLCFFAVFFSALLFVVKSAFLKENFHSIFHFFNGAKGLIETGLTHSIEERLKALLALKYAFFEHLIAGIGLGGAMTLNHAQEQCTIHNTALWFLIEMGIIGFAAFVWFIYKLATALRTSQDVYIKALTLPLLSFAIASLANELFYQRYFWLLVGMITYDYSKRSHKETPFTLLKSNILPTS
ncbi:MAG: hypothetical protein V4482_01650 [Pseudomonadota bacterium]